MRGKQSAGLGLTLSQQHKDSAPCFTQAFALQEPNSEQHG